MPKVSKKGVMRKKSRKGMGGQPFVHPELNERLKELIEAGWSINETKRILEEETGIRLVRSTIRYRLRHLNVKTKNKRGGSVQGGRKIDEELVERIRKLYWEEGLSPAEIAPLVGLKTSLQVTGRMRSGGIPKRSQEEAARLVGSYVSRRKREVHKNKEGSSARSTGRSNSDSSEGATC